MQKTRLLISRLSFPFLKIVFPCCLIEFSIKQAIAKYSDGIPEMAGNRADYLLKSFLRADFIKKESKILTQKTNNSRHWTHHSLLIRLR